MSQHIGDVPSYPLTDPESMGPGREHTIGIGRFWGGERKTCVQLTMGSRFVQLDQAGVEQLIRYLDCAIHNGHEFVCTRCGTEHEDNHS